MRNRTFLIGLLTGIFLTGAVWVVHRCLSEIAYSNRRLVHIQHPITGSKLSLLVLAGPATDFTYIIDGDYQPLSIPKSADFLEFNEPFAIGFNDTSWVIYYTEGVYERSVAQLKGVELMKISDGDYRAEKTTDENYKYFIFGKEERLFYKYYF